MWFARYSEFTQRSMEEFSIPLVSEVLSGKRELNKDHIKRLSRRFYVSPELFF